jgi:BlaI family penicillinase repressor
MIKGPEINLSLKNPPHKSPLDSSPFPYATVSNIMNGNTAPEHDPAELGALERSILLLTWRLGTVTAEQVREGLGRPLKDSTIRTVLRRLEEKGYLTHSVENRTFFYSPAESPQRVAGRAVQRIVDWFCEGSVEALLVGMVDSKVLGRAELQRLAERIAAAKSAAPAKKESRA